MRYAAVHISDGLSQAEQQALEHYAEALQPWEVLEVTHTQGRPWDCLICRECERSSEKTYNT